MVLAWSSDAKRLAAIDDAGTVFVCSVPMDQPPTQVARNPGWGWARGVWWFKNDSALAVGGTDAMRIWDYEPGRMSRLVREISSVMDGAKAVSAAAGLAAIESNLAIRLHRLEDGQLVRTVLPLNDGQWAVLSPEGHMSGSPGVEKEFVYVVQTEEGQETLSPAEFAKKYGWKNDPEKAVPTGDGGPGKGAAGVEEGEEQKPVGTADASTSPSSKQPPANEPSSEPAVGKRDAKGNITASWV